MAQTHEREIDSHKKAGSCPYCNSDRYTRFASNDESDDPKNYDSFILECECERCGNTFKETFVLRFQNWETEGNNDKNQI